MRRNAHLFSLFGLLLACLGSAHAASSPSNSPGFRLILELRDGSRIVGKSSDTTFPFHSDVLGDISLALARIQTVESPNKTNMARLTIRNGDELSVRFATNEIRVEAGFGDLRLPVELIRRMQVSVLRAPGSLRPGVVALWNGEGTLDDVAGLNNPTTPRDIRFVEGKVGQAMALTSVDTWMKIPASSALDLGAGDGLSLTAWIKPSNVIGLHPILEWAAGRGENGIQLWIGNRPESRGVLGAAFFGTDGKLRELASAAGMLAANRFQHVALTYDKSSGEGALYLNGVNVARQKWEPFVPRTAADLWIGHRVGDVTGDWTYGAFLDGLLDELTLYNRVLPPAEIMAVCTEENGGQPPPPPTAAPPNEPLRDVIPGNGLRPILAPPNR